MKKQCFILGVALLLGGTSCIKDWHKPPATVTVSTFAGKNVWGTADGVGTAASFFLPSGIAIDAADNLYVTDNGSGLIRKVTPQAVVTTLAGSGKSESYSDGQGSAASFWFPEGIAVDASGYIYVGDSHNNRIRKITPTGLVTTFAGSGVQAHADGIGTAASFYNPSGVALDASGNI